jgi:hypothetical protein
VREILDRLSVGVALDAACGTGRHTVYLASLGHLRPNGHLVISDSRGLIGDIGLPLVRVGPGGEFGYMPTYARLASDYLAAALPLGLQVHRCEEPRTPSPLLGDDGVTLHHGVPLPDPVPGDPPYIWSLHALAIDATNAAWRGKPAAIIWHFQLAAD